MRIIEEYFKEIIGMMICIPLIVLIFIASFSKHEINGYYLSGKPDANELNIRVDVNWSPDNKIILDRSVTYDEAVDLVKKMNDNLKRK